MRISTDLIKIDGGTQSRASLSIAIVDEYAENIDALPPVTVYFDGSDYWLADGFHRYHAHRKAGSGTISAVVESGTVRDAILHSVGANAAHGLRRTNDDKRKAGMALLGDLEWSQWSDREIARRCGVSANFVGELRRSLSSDDSENMPASELRPSLSSDDSENSRVRTYTNKHGSSTTINTARIGKVAKSDSTPAVNHGEEIQRAKAESEDDGTPDDAEIAAAMAQDEADRSAFDRLLLSDDRLLEAWSEVKRLNAVVVGLKSRIVGLQNECNAAKRQAKYWKKQAECKAA